MRIKTEQLQAFLTVSRLQSVSRAAEALNLTQPAVTARIKALEDSLGTMLFDRGSYGMQLTKRGDMLVHYAEQFQQLSDLVEKNVVDDGAVDRLIRLGVSETIAQSWLPDFVGALRARYPLMKIEISVDISINLRDQLLRREIDLAVLLGPVSDYTVDNVLLPEMPLAWFKASDSVGNQSVDLAKIPIATYAKNTRPFRELRAEMFERYGSEISFFPSSSLSSCFRMIEAGLCVGALPTSVARAWVEKGTLVEFDPGWLPKPLQFSASFLGEPRSHLIEEAAEIAGEQARLNV